MNLSNHIVTSIKRWYSSVQLVRMGSRIHNAALDWGIEAEIGTWFEAIYYQIKGLTMPTLTEDRSSLGLSIVAPALTSHVHEKVQLCRN